MPFTVEAPPLRLKGQELFPLNKSKMLKQWNELKAEHVFAKDHPTVFKTPSAAPMSAEAHEASVAAKDAVIAAMDAG